MIQIQLRPELETQMSAEAQARGLALEQYIVEKLEAFTPFRSSVQAGTADTIENLRDLRQEQIAQQASAVEEMSQFAARHGFIHGDEDFRTTAHEGHKY